MPDPISISEFKWLLKHPGQSWQFLLASETGSGKSIAYLLPLLQNLKETELMSSSQPFISEKRLRTHPSTNSRARTATL